MPPSSVVLDDFNRSALGSDWTPIAGYGSPTISGNLFAGGGAAYVAERYGPDCEAHVTLASGGGDFGVLLLIANPGTGGATDGYYVEGNTSARQIRLYRVDNSVPVLLTSTSVTWAAGDAIGATVEGTTITAWRRPVGGEWAAVLSRVDATYQLAGFAGLYANGTRLDDFGAGALGGGEHHSGSAALSSLWAVTASAVKRAASTATAGSSWAATALGVKRVTTSGSVTAPWTSTASGAKNATASGTMVASWAPTASGAKWASAAASVSWTASLEAVGEVVPDVSGEAVMSVAFTAAAATGWKLGAGSASASATLAGSILGVKASSGGALATVTLAGHPSGVKVALVEAVATLGVTLDAVGAAMGAPVRVVLGARAPRALVDARAAGVALDGRAPRWGLEARGARAEVEVGACRLLCQFLKT